jgi:hypothetical protein
MRFSEQPPRFPHKDYGTFEPFLCAPASPSAAVAELGSLGRLPPPQTKRSTMKRIINSLALVPLLFMIGCVTADKIVTDTTPRSPTTSVDVYKDGKIPEGKYKEIAELSFLGPREEELRAQKRFIRQAKELGGNGILFTVVPAGQKGGGAFGASGGGFGFSTSWVFAGKVIVYE